MTRSSSIATRGAKVTPIRRTSRPKLSEIHLDRDIFLELCEELEYFPLQLAAS